MTRKVLLFAMATLLGVGVAFAQETGTGAGRVEIGAIPVGGVMFMKSTNGTEPKFGNYVLGGSVTGNVNRFIGIEGDLGFGMGRRQDLTFNGAQLTDQKTPNLLTYSGSVVYHPAGKDRAVVPYVIGGAGAMTMFNTTDAANLGLTQDKTYFTANVGGGLKWFPMSHWGLRGDYRYIAINKDTAAPAFFGQQELRHAHRVYGALVLTF